MNNYFKQCLLPITLMTMMSPALAEHSEQNTLLQDAWLDGKLGAVIVLNQHLNPLTIESDVVDSKAIISGKVHSEIQKTMMTELALGIEGIQAVDNLLEVTPREEDAITSDDVVEDMLDASITTAISTKLLLNPNINSSEINVDTIDKQVVIGGMVSSEIESELTEQIAQNTFEVDTVLNQLVVVN